MLGFNPSKEITKFTNHNTSESNMRCDICIRELWHDISGNVYLLEQLNFLTRALNKPDSSPREEIFWFCKNFITKLTDYFFTITDLGTASFGNEYLFTQQRDNSTLIKCFGPMHIYFDEYPPYVVESLKFLNF